MSVQMTCQQIQICITIFILSQQKCIQFEYTQANIGSVVPDIAPCDFGKIVNYQVAASM